MKVRGLFVAVITLLMCFVTIGAYAYDIAIQNARGITIYYNIINEGRELEVTYQNNHYNSYSGVVAIPEIVTFLNKTRRVTRIGGRAFLDCRSLTSVSIPDSVKSIGSYAFSNCRSLTSVAIPDSVKVIGEYAFNGCNGLTAVYIKDLAAWCETSFKNYMSNPLYYAHHLYLNDQELTDLVIPEGMKMVREHAFEYCHGLSSVVVTDSVKSIGDGAFSGCIALTSVTLADSVRIIKNNAFSGCRSLTSVAIPDSVGNYAFFDCRSLTSVTLPDSVKTIGFGAFENCDLKSVVSRIEEPFAITGKENDRRTFSLNTFNNATLYVPLGTIDKYMKKAGWQDFVNIIEIGEEDALNDVKGDGDKTEIYTLDGKKVDRMQRGVNVVNGKKVVIK